MDIVALEQLPWTEMAMVHAVENDTHSFPSGDERRDTDHEWNERHDSPTTSCTAQAQQNASNNPAEDASNAETAGENDARAVAVADGPANEIGV